MYVWLHALDHEPDVMPSMDTTARNAKKHDKEIKRRTENFLVISLSSVMEIKK